MKLLILLFIISSCIKVSNAPIREKSFNAVQVSGIHEDLNNLRPEIDTMVAFLWPQDVSSVAAKRGIREVIKTSRELNQKQEVYLDEKYRLTQAFKKHDCDCVLNGICSEEGYPEDDGVCYDIEAQTYQNEERLIPIYELVEKIEAAVLSAGGEWFKTHLDYPELPPSKIDLLKNELFFTSLFSTEELYSIGPVKFLLEERTGFLALESQLKDQTGRNWKLEVGLKKRAGSMSFQGKLTSGEGALKREGVIQWVNPFL